MTKSVTLSEAQTSALALLSSKEQRPIAQLVQEAVDEFLARKQHGAEPDFESGLGLWGGGEDGLAYQERLRSEW